MTLIFKRKPELNPDLNPATELVGARIPDHQFIREIARYCKEPIALTSANLSASKSCLKVQVCCNPLLTAFSCFKKFPYPPPPNLTLFPRSENFVEMIHEFLKKQQQYDMHSKATSTFYFILMSHEDQLRGGGAQHPFESVQHC